MFLSFKYKLYPNKSQADSIEKTFGYCRFVYNNCITERVNHYNKTGKLLPLRELINLIPIWKKTTAPWLAEAPSQALQQSVRDLDKSYRTYFKKIREHKKAKPPRYKRKKNSRQTYRVPAQNNCVRIIDCNHIKLPKLGSVRCKVSREPLGKIYSATIIRNSSGNYFVRLLCGDIEEPVAPDSTSITGIDLGLKDMMIRSDGVIVKNEKSFYALEKKLAAESKKLSMKKKGSNNFEKQRKRVAKIHQKIVDKRRDAIHKATTSAIRESQAIAVESLDVKEMATRHNLGKAVHDAALGTILIQLEYKARLYGRGFVKVSKWFPSSKTCHVCGYKYDGLTLDMRHWRCPFCGTNLNRDINAAINIANEGMRLLKETGTVGRTGTGSCQTPD